MDNISEKNTEIVNDNNAELQIAEQPLNNLSVLPQISETDTIKFDVPNPNTIVVSGIDKQEVGQMSAVIRGKRPPEPYHGKGVKYSDEKIRRKAGKTGK